MAYVNDANRRCDGEDDRLTNGHELINQAEVGQKRNGSVTRRNCVSAAEGRRWRLRLGQTIPLSELAVWGSSQFGAATGGDSHGSFDGRTKTFLFKRCDACSRRTARRSYVCS